MNSNLVPFTFNNVIDRLFDDFDHKLYLAPEKNNLTQLKANIKEVDEGYMITVAVPGIKKEDLDIELNQNKLTVSISSTETPEASKHYIMKEILTNKATRSFILPTSVTESSVGAELKDGMLNITLKKISNTKKISVN